MTAPASAMANNNAPRFLGILRNRKLPTFTVIAQMSCDLWFFHSATFENLYKTKTREKARFVLTPSLNSSIAPTIITFSQLRKRGKYHREV